MRYREGVPAKATGRMRSLNGGEIGLALLLLLVSAGGATAQVPDTCRTSWVPVLGANSDAGLVLGIGLAHADGGARATPFASRTSVRAAFGTGSGRAGVGVMSRIETGLRGVDLVLAARATGVEPLRLYRPGNESDEAEDRGFHQVRNWQVDLAPAIEVTLGQGLVAGLGPRVRWVRTELDRDRLIGFQQPYGGGSFAQLGGRGYLRLERRDRGPDPRRGLLVELGGDLVPPALDVERTFGSASVAVTGFLRTAGRWSPILYMHAGARRVWGRYPWFEAAQIGGSRSVRGYSGSRYQGDAAVYAQTELRIPVAEATLVTPGTFGVLGLADIGRVYLAGESSDRWHAGVGGGVWFAWQGGTRIFSLTLARGAERAAVSVRVGSAF
jgi:Haemolysin secretion/activation protein ShlB/FhaC/HecB